LKEIARDNIIGLSNSRKRGVITIKIIDITRELNEDIKIYEGDPPFLLENFYTVENNGFAIARLSMGTHTGSHIDAPSHVIPGGKNVRDIPLSQLVGECILVEKNSMKVPSGIKKVIIKGSDEKSGRITENQARRLVDAGIRLLGTNSISIGSDEVHKILLSEGCSILEYLDLAKAETGTVYMLCAMPLKISADGSPVRACLIQGVCE
jgi:arylformamidase